MSDGRDWAEETERGIDPRIPASYAPTDDGKYVHRYGPAYRADGDFCNVKLCFVATDLEVLVSELETLALRDDCVYVKLSIAPRDGMYIGRCFLMSRIAVGHAWKEYKRHPRLFVSIQDDDFTRAYR
ncbi:MAG: hypothetical protein AB7S26_11045 [Sandaracinaceae bacterium]